MLSLIDTRTTRVLFTVLLFALALGFLYAARRTLVAFLFASLPFFDRRMERRPWKRPIAVGVYTFIFLALFGLGYTSYRSDHRDPGYAAQLLAQQKETDEFMRTPFEPVAESSVSSLIAASTDPLITEGSQIYQAQSCPACHGEGGIGSAAGTRLTGTHERWTAEQLSALLQSPSAKMTAGGMTPLDLKPEAMRALVAYLESL